MQLAYGSLILVLGLTAAGAYECDLRITGFTVNGTDLNGNWNYFGGHEVTRNGSSAFATDYAKNQHSNIMLQYDGSRSLWAISALDERSLKSRELAVCRSAKCAASMDLSALGDREQWELRVEEAYAPNPGTVSVGCCPHEANKCHTCQDSECYKYTSYAQCLVASAWSCCQAQGWIHGAGCTCKETRFTCLPYDGTSANNTLLV